ncbi:hypothetical protein FRC06_005519 [Ceratobasidium sp. 370]|nr:hypothetical protein FRC06_005519 [Ceratobasidium sp. 370]
MAFTRGISLAIAGAVVAASHVLGAANPKRGLCFAEGDNPGDIKLANQTGTALTWTYNWGQSPPDYLKTPNFLKACTGCTIDFIPIHWYGSGVGAFYDYIWAIHSEFAGYPIWVTEFAETSSDDAVVANFLNATINYMDTLDWIERYSWFAFFRQETGSHYNLLNANGTLNTLGHLYIGK